MKMCSTNTLNTQPFLPFCNGPTFGLSKSTCGLGFGVQSFFCHTKSNCFLFHNQGRLETKNGVEHKHIFIHFHTKEPFPLGYYCFCFNKSIFVKTKDFFYAKPFAKTKCFTKGQCLCLKKLDVFFLKKNNSILSLLVVFKHHC